MRTNLIFSTQNFAKTLNKETFAKSLNKITFEKRCGSQLFYCTLFPTVSIIWAAFNVNNLIKINKNEMNKRKIKLHNVNAIYEPITFNSIDLLLNRLS